MKMRALILGILTVLSIGAHGTQITPTPIAKLVSNAEYIVVGKVVKVDIVDAEGRELRDPDARTGPGSENTLRLHVLVERGHIIKGDRKKVPAKIIVPNWKAWHNKLKYERGRREGKTFIFLLKGEDFSPVSLPESVRSMSERTTIEKLAK